MKKIIYIMVIFVVSLYTACSDMNDSMDPYLSKGEIIYLAKSDSVKLFAGKERFLLRFWLSDPRATDMYVYWNQKSDSLIIPLPENRNFADSLDIYIGKEERISEGGYTLQLVTYDKYKNTSIPDEYNVSVYGKLFENTLIVRQAKSAQYISGNVKIEWGGSYNAKEYGVKLFYISKEGKKTEELYTTEALKKGLCNEDGLEEVLVLSDIDVSQPLVYTTVYLPEPTAIDTFYTKENPIIIKGLPK